MPMSERVGPPARRASQIEHPSRDRSACGDSPGDSCAVYLLGAAGLRRRQAASDRAQGIPYGRTQDDRPMLTVPARASSSAASTSTTSPALEVGVAERVRTTPPRPRRVYLDKGCVTSWGVVQAWPCICSAPHSSRSWWGFHSSWRWRFRVLPDGRRQLSPASNVRVGQPRGVRPAHPPPIRPLHLGCRCAVRADRRQHRQIAPGVLGLPTEVCLPSPTALAFAVVSFIAFHKGVFHANESALPDGSSGSEIVAR